VPDGVSRGQIALYAAAALAVLLLGARYLRGQEPSPGAGAGGAPQVRVEQAPEGKATVHVEGAVRRPGVYELRPGARIDEAVRRAGGATARADLTQVNLAAKVQDGRQVLVPERAGTEGGAGPAAGASGGAAGAAPGVPLNLNTATLEQLDALPGVGPVTAEKILAHRQEKGGFGSVEELGQIPGIGEKRLASLRDLVRV
jgi:competence protein ComEA